MCRREDKQKESRDDAAIKPETKRPRRMFATLWSSVPPLCLCGELLFHHQSVGLQPNRNIQNHQQARIIFDIWRKPIMRRSICALALLLVILPTIVSAQVKKWAQSSRFMKE